MLISLIFLNINSFYNPVILVSYYKANFYMKLGLKWALFFSTSNLQAETNKTAKIHCRVREVYSENFMNDCVVRGWCRQFLNGLMFMMKVDKDASLSLILCSAS